jgi:geranylgeranyl pyrophosphate synthase
MKRNAPSRTDPGDFHRVGDRLCERLRPYRGMVEAALDPLFTTNSSLDHAIRHALFANAKRVRASLALIASEAAGGTARNALPIAVAFELLHTASLIHDDIMDGALLRRGRSCVHHAFGTGLAITAGDALIFEAYRILRKSFAQNRAADQAIDIFTSCAAMTCRGQALDLDFPNHPASLHRYLRMVRAKTGSMIEAPIECAALLAGASRDCRDRFREYGRHLGIAFQITDDATDYLGSEAKAEKTLGNDLRNGAGSALLIFTHRASSAAERETLRAAIRRARVAHTTDAVAALVATMQQHGAIEWTERLCARYADRALRALQGIGVEPARTELAAIARIIGQWKVSRPPTSKGASHEARRALVH